MKLITDKVLYISVASSRKLKTLTLLVLSKVDGGSSFLGSILIELSGAFIWGFVEFILDSINNGFNKLNKNNMLKISKVITGVFVVAAAFNL